MITQLKHHLIIVLSMTLISSAWAQDVLSPAQINVLATANENRYDLPNISYTYTEWGFKIRLNHIKLDHIVDYTLNGKIITDAIKILIEQEIITLIEKNDKGFEFEVLFAPEILPNDSEFGVILDNGLKVSCVIYDPINGLFPVWSNLINWNNQSKNRLLVKGYVKQYEPNCGFRGCYKSVPEQWVQIYIHNGQNWVYKETVYSDNSGFYNFLIEDYCGEVAAYTAKAGKEVWQEQNVWTSCTPFINEQAIILQLK
ncbi:hypothetical protein PN36_05070 [Candidatus Thiomargarita nelsonii]|uniref:Secreted protein n=1 Tax=Candidatus Thiomargarita nelsonii TaxID=1003181 RepID=A0A0A6PG51_9GAMM|nr:hypothetical protein PN36_05070 [Candidatus Thiomargarita nelsonii]